MTTGNFVAQGVQAACVLLLWQTVLLLEAEATRVKDLRGDFSRLQQIRLFDDKAAEKQTRQTLVLPGHHADQVPRSESVHVAIDSRSHRRPEAHSQVHKASVPPAKASVPPPKASSRGNAQPKTQTPVAQIQSEQGLGSSLSVLEQDPRWNSVFRLAQEAAALRNPGVVAPEGPERALGGALVEESAASLGPERTKVKVSGAGGFFLDPSTGKMKAGKRGSTGTAREKQAKPREASKRVKPMGSLPQPSPDWVQKHLEVQHALQNEASQLRAEVNGLVSAPQQLHVALQSQMKTEAQVKALKLSKEASTEATLQASRASTEHAIEEVSKTLRSKSEVVHDLEKKKSTWHRIASAAADPHNRTHTLRARALSDAVGTEVLLEEKVVQRLRQDKMRLESATADEARAIEASTGTTSTAGLEKLLQKSKTLRRLELQRNQLEASRRHTLEEIQGLQVRGETAKTSLSRTLDRLDAACTKTKQEAARQHVALRRATDAIKLLELEQSGLKDTLRKVIPGALKVKKVKDAVAVLTKARRKQWTQLVGLQEKLRETRRSVKQRQKLSEHASEVQRLHQEVSRMQGKNKALQVQLKYAAKDILALHEQQVQLAESGVVENAKASQTAEQQALAEHQRLEEQLHQLQLALTASRSTASRNMAMGHRHSRTRGPALLERESWVAPPMVRWRAREVPMQEEVLLNSNAQNNDMPEEQESSPDEQLPQEESSLDEEAAIQAQQSLEDAMSDSTYQSFSFDM